MTNLHQILSWEEVPDSMMGWLCRYQRVFDGETRYGVVGLDDGSKVYANWQFSEEEALNAYRSGVPTWTWVRRSNVILLRYVGNPSITNETSLKLAWEEVPDDIKDAKPGEWWEFTYKLSGYDANYRIRVSRVLGDDIQGTPWYTWMPNLPFETAVEVQATGTWYFGNINTAHMVDGPVTESSLHLSWEEVPDFTYLGEWLDAGAPDLSVGTVLFAGNLEDPQKMHYKVVHTHPTVFVHLEAGASEEPFYRWMPGWRWDTSVRRLVECRTTHTGGLKLSWEEVPEFGDLAEWIDAGAPDLPVGTNVGGNSNHHYRVVHAKPMIWKHIGSGDRIRFYCWTYTTWIWDRTIAGLIERVDPHRSRASLKLSWEEVPDYLYTTDWVLDGAPELPRGTELLGGSRTVHEGTYRVVHTNPMVWEHLESPISKRFYRWFSGDSPWIRKESIEELVAMRSPLGSLKLSWDIVEDPPSYPRSDFGYRDFWSYDAMTLREMKQIEVDERGNEWFDDSGYDLDHTKCIWIVHDPEEAARRDFSAELYMADPHDDNPAPGIIEEPEWEEFKRAMAEPENYVEKVDLTNGWPVLEDGDGAYLYVLNSLQPTQGAMASWEVVPDPDDPVVVEGGTSGSRWIINFNTLMAWAELDREGQQPARDEVVLLAPESTGRALWAYSVPGDDNILDTARETSQKIEKAYQEWRQRVGKTSSLKLSWDPVFVEVGDKLQVNPGHTPILYAVTYIVLANQLESLGLTSGERFVTDKSQRHDITERVMASDVEVVIVERSAGGSGSDLAWLTMQSLGELLDEGVWKVVREKDASLKLSWEEVPEVIEIRVPWDIHAPMFVDFSNMKYWFNSSELPLTEDNAASLRRISAGRWEYQHPDPEWRAENLWGHNWSPPATQEYLERAYQAWNGKTASMWEEVPDEFHVGDKVRVHSKSIPAGVQYATFEVSIRWNGTDELYITEIRDNGIDRSGIISYRLDKDPYTGISEGDWYRANDMELLESSRTASLWEVVPEFGTLAEWREAGRPRLPVGFKIYEGTPKMRGDELEVVHEDPVIFYDVEYRLYYVTTLFGTSRDIPTGDWIEGGSIEEVLRRYEEATIGRTASKWEEVSDEVAIKTPGDNRGMFVDFANMTYWFTFPGRKITKEKPGLLRRNDDGTWEFRSLREVDIWSSNWRYTDTPKYIESAYQATLGTTSSLWEVVEGDDDADTSVLLKELTDLDLIEVIAEISVELDRRGDPTTPWDLEFCSMAKRELASRGIPEDDPRILEAIIQNEGA